jgi:hypothetical protein
MKSWPFGQTIVYSGKPKARKLGLHIGYLMLSNRFEQVSNRHPMQLQTFTLIESLLNPA